ncbi:MAG TPA: hypothetical protein VHL77_09955, partial [Ferruginibacter sp.]|nr:hypothetical protein [Ferruginibacter sp.]
MFYQSTFPLNFPQAKSSELISIKSCCDIVNLRHLNSGIKPQATNHMNLFEQQQFEFSGRHIGPNETESREMLKTIGVNDLDELIDRTVPAAIRLKAPLKL